MPRGAIAGELIFEAHATSVDNERGVASGHFDAALSTAGEQQAREMGVRYQNTPLAAVYCSDLQRAWRTADIAFAGREVPILRTPLLRECDYGTETRGPMAALLKDRARHLTQPYPGGESYADVVGRVGAFLTTLACDGCILIVGHRAVWYALEHLLAGVPLADAVRVHWNWQPGWRYRRKTAR